MAVVDGRPSGRKPLSREEVEACTDGPLKSLMLTAPGLRRIDVAQPVNTDSTSGSPSKPAHGQMDNKGIPSHE